MYQVVRAPAPKHGQVSQIRHHTSQPFFRGIPSPFGATQFNSLVVSNEGLPDELEAIAWAESRGEECIMALRHRSSPLWGVQFHPEVSPTPSCMVAMLTKDLNHGSQFHPPMEQYYYQTSYPSRSITIPIRIDHLRPRSQHIC